MTAAVSDDFGLNVNTSSSSFRFGGSPTRQHSGAAAGGHSGAAFGQSPPAPGGFGKPSSKGFGANAGGYSGSLFSQPAPSGFGSSDFGQPTPGVGIHPASGGLLGNQAAPTGFGSAQPASQTTFGTPARKVTTSAADAATIESQEEKGAVWTGASAGLPMFGGSRGPPQSEASASLEAEPELAKEAPAKTEPAKAEAVSFRSSTAALVSEGKFGQRKVGFRQVVANTPVCAAAEDQDAPAEDEADTTAGAVGVEAVPEVGPTGFSPSVKLDGLKFSFKKK